MNTALERIVVPDLRPLIIYALLVSSISYVIYQSAPQFGMKRMKGRIATQTCVGNTAPFGCRLEVEFYDNNTVHQKTFTGSFPKKFDTFEEIEVWVDPKDPNNSTVQNSWSGEGLILAILLIFVLFMYHTLRK
jgi:hypothetical protein